MRELEPAEIRKLIEAVSVLATRPAQATERTLGEALGYFQILIEQRSQGAVQIQIYIAPDEE